MQEEEPRKNRMPITSNNPFNFKNLHKDELDMLENETIEVDYKKPETIFKQGEFVTKAVYIKTGYVKLYQDYRNLTRTFSILPAGNFACLPAVITRDKFLYTISAFAGTTVCQTNIEVIRQLFQDNGRFAWELTKKSNETLVKYHFDRLFQFCPGSTIGKLSRMLIFLSDKVFFSDTFDILLSRIEFSQLTGISRENAIRLLSSLRDKGFIDIQGKIVSITNRTELEKLSHSR